MSSLKYVALAACLLLVGCNAPVGLDPNGINPTDDDADPNAIPDGEDGTPEPDGDGGAVLTGRILPSQSAKRAPRSQTADLTYMVVAQSDATGELYRATTDATGDFQLALPETEAGNALMVTILGPDGRAVGPVLFGTAGEDGLTGLAPAGDVSLGTIVLPDDPTTTPIEPGADADDLSGLLDPDLAARLDANGVPIGLASHGKGDEALIDAPADDRVVDSDEDGLIDMLDADDDGNGLVDDFDTGDVAGGGPADVHVNFFMNLKIQAEEAETYYSGTADEIAAALGVNTIITLECMTEPGATRAITAVHALETPGPAYMPDADVMVAEESGDTFANWAGLDYAFNEATDRFEAFVRPNAVMDAGDTFTVQIAFDDGTTAQYSRMINYVFKNIPKLLQYGQPGALIDFDVTDPDIDGSPTHPIPFDGTQDLTLVFNPPPDETGAYLTALDYTFQFFYYAADDGNTIDSADIDADATWPDPIPNFEGTTLWVDNADLELSAAGTYSVTLPKELFPDVVQLVGGGEEAVGAYKIDITAECPSGNAAIMLVFRKQ